MIQGEITMKTHNFPTNIPWEFPGIHTELVQGVAGPKEQSGNVPGHDLFGDMGRRGVLVSAEWKMRGFGWDGRWIWLVTVDGCWLSFWLEIACCRKKIWSCIFVFVRPIVRTMYVFLGERCHQRKDLCFRSLGFLWEGTSKKASSQSTNLSWWSDQPSLSAIWKHPMNLLPLYKKPRQPTPICICRWRIRSFPRDSLVTYIPADSFLPFIFGSSRAILNEKLPVFFAVITYPFVFPSFLGPGTKDHI